MGNTSFMPFTVLSYKVMFAIPHEESFVLFFLRYRILKSGGNTYMYLEISLPLTSEHNPDENK